MSSAFFSPSGLVADRDGAVAELLPWCAPDSALRLAEERVDDLGGGAFAITRTIENAGDAPVAFRDELRVRDCFEASRYLIPCVNYDGNGVTEVESSEFKVQSQASSTFQPFNLSTFQPSTAATPIPTGLSRDGEPWRFSYERTGIPGCTLTENTEIGVALFAAADTPQSLVCACGLEKVESSKLKVQTWESASRQPFNLSTFQPFKHILVRPVVEAPLTYEAKGVFGPRHESAITLAPGERFTAKSFVCVCRPKWPNYAFAALAGHALRLLSPRLAPCMDKSEAFDLGIRFIHSLLYPYKGKWLVCEHVVNRMAHDCSAMRISREEMAERMKWEYWTDLGTWCETFEVGWAGQNFLNARMLALRALGFAAAAPAAASGDSWAEPPSIPDPALLEKAIGIFDAFVATQRPNGLLYRCYNDNFFEGALEKRPTDACNMGWAAAEAVRMARLLRAHGIGKPEYVAFAERICDFFVSHWSDADGFGKRWRVDGTPLERDGTIGGFLIPALTELYDETGERRWLDAALRASDFYFARDLDGFLCTAGAIDCQCIDKETAWPFVFGSLALYRITGDRKHLERAEKAAWYFISWMFFFDTISAPESDFAKYGYHTTGGTAVSLEHQCIDPWGAIIVPDLMELANATGNDDFREFARLMWANSLQGITRRLGEFFHDKQRPIGSQNEGFSQARYNKYRPVVEPGYFNDVLAPWPSAFRMWTVARMKLKS
ncbi:MAG: hypothetical protein ILM98_14650 [Kiritimatiellae bacterium]|nr:hypothetical protein [Kiritimatiellia bacterium]